MRRTMIAMSLTTMSLYPLLLTTPASAATNEQKMRGPAAKPTEKKG
jgi:hypothetical protein